MEAGGKGNWSRKGIKSAEKTGIRYCGPLQWSVVNKILTFWCYTDRKNAHVLFGAPQYRKTWIAHLQIDTDIGDDVRIRSDGELLNLVWSNLISNAIKFTPEGGTIGVSMKSDGKLVTVSVRDTGCGIKPEVGRHIFEKFYQADPSHATKGNGLGLALVKRVVDILKGEIDVRSVYGQGSTFTVRFRRDEENGE